MNAATRRRRQADENEDGRAWERQPVRFLLVTCVRQPGCLADARRRADDAGTCFEFLTGGCKLGQETFGISSCGWWYGLEPVCHQIGGAAGRL